MNFSNHQSVHITLFKEKESFFKRSFNKHILLIFNNLTIFLIFLKIHAQFFNLSLILTQIFYFSLNFYYKYNKNNIFNLKFYKHYFFTYFNLFFNKIVETSNKIKNLINLFFIKFFNKIKKINNFINKKLFILYNFNIFLIGKNYNVYTGNIIPFYQKKLMWFVGTGLKLDGECSESVLSAEEFDQLIWSNFEKNSILKIQNFSMNLKNFNIHKRLKHYYYLYLNFTFKYVKLQKNNFLKINKKISNVNVSYYFFYKKNNMKHFKKLKNKTNEIKKFSYNFFINLFTSLIYTFKSFYSFFNLENKKINLFFYFLNSFFIYLKSIILFITFLKKLKIYYFNMQSNLPIIFNKFYTINLLNLFFFNNLFENKKLYFLFFNFFIKKKLLIKKNKKYNYLKLLNRSINFNYIKTKKINFLKKIKNKKYNFLKNLNKFKLNFLFFKPYKFKYIKKNNKKRRLEYKKIQQFKKYQFRKQKYRFFKLKKKKKKKQFILFLKKKKNKLSRTKKRRFFFLKKKLLFKIKKLINLFKNKLIKPKPIKKNKKTKKYINNKNMYIILKNLLQILKKKRLFNSIKYLKFFYKKFQIFYRVKWSVLKYRKYRKKFKKKYLKSPPIYNFLGRRFKFDNAVDHIEFLNPLYNLKMKILEKRKDLKKKKKQLKTFIFKTFNNNDKLKIRCFIKIINKKIYNIINIFNKKYLNIIKSIIYNKFIFFNKFQLILFNNLYFLKIFSIFSFLFKLNFFFKNILIKKYEFFYYYKNFIIFEEILENLNEFTITIKKNKFNFLYIYKVIFEKIFLIEIYLKQFFFILIKIKKNCFKYKYFFFNIIKYLIILKKKYLYLTTLNFFFNIINKKNLLSDKFTVKLMNLCTLKKKCISSLKMKIKTKYNFFLMKKKTKKYFNYILRNIRKYKKQKKQKLKTIIK
jgi:hypothetical protein